MKPINLNQLLFHPKSHTLTFYQAPLAAAKDPLELDRFMDDMHSQLLLQKRDELVKVLESSRGKIMKLIKGHPDKSHGFFLAPDLEGYVILDHTVEPYCTIGQTFHVRPMLAELSVNPEFMVVNVSLYDIKIYRGDFQYLEIIEQYDFDELPKAFFGTNHARLYSPQYLGLIPFKTIMALKTIAQKITDMILYHSMPVIVTGLEEIKNIFLRYFEHSFGVITHLQEDFYEKTCVEILERCKNFRSIIMDYYSAQLKEKLKRLMKSKRLVSDIGQILEALKAGRVIHLIIPTERKLWGRINFETGEYSLHKKVSKRNSMDILNELADRFMQEGGRIQVLGPHFFPENTNVLAILRG